ncbi:MAG: valine--tRNA ligase [Cenarchaeum sp. SB0665_bin_23]|nr:valine--tRNA ligase [Cenarchaeum sp. SB0665_bin_23]MYB46115.1 valine--tRNA ligase [Cenarchaeum sp. SB0662_bin_33]MYG33500.1 valine--tRNA ligase [Cenarchaeum sp. SB0677_bin_16]
MSISAKAWDPDIEKEILQRWECDTYDTKDADSYFTIDTPPPYPSGRPWHIGAAAHYAQIDMIARTARMAGEAVYFPIGIDRNGLPVEIYTEKKLNIRMRDTPREKFLEMCRESLDELEGEMVQIMKSLGISGDINNRYRTDTPEYRALTQATFIELWNKGRIYQATRPNNYDWVSGTTIADAEITYQNIATKLVYMKFAIDDTYIIIASTRPEMLCACQAIIVNPEDTRYKKYIGRRAKVPIFDRHVEVKSHSSARMEFGSGAVMVCSYGDQNDVMLFREMGLAEIISIGIDGRMTKAAGAYAGLRPKQARDAIIQDMKDSDIIERIEDITHRTPISERSKTPIEIIPMDEYYMKQKDSVERLRSMSGNIRFHPPMHHQILLNWLDSINIDWPISRRRYYGTEVPIWYCKRCSHPHVPPAGRYYQPWRQRCPIESCVKCENREFVGESRTFDTWMDSSVSPLFISGYYTSDDEFFKKRYPAAIRPQSKDIVRTWLYYTLLRCEALTGEIPWSDAWIMGYGVDERGLKMSKSRGNAIDPLPVIQKYGADAFRLWSASEVNHGYDFRCNEQKIQSTKKFLSKLWNVSRLLSEFPVVSSDNLEETDRWIIQEADGLIKRCMKGYGEYNFFVPAIAIREFTWNVFAAHYIEMVKRRARGDGFTIQQRDAARHTLHYVLRVILRLLAPIIPFITEYIWGAIYLGNSIHRERHPEPLNHTYSTASTEDIILFNSYVWNEKKAQRLSLKDEIDADIPISLQGMDLDLRAMHNIIS